MCEIGKPTEVVIVTVNSEQPLPPLRPKPVETITDDEATMEDA